MQAAQPGRQLRQHYRQAGWQAQRRCEHQAAQCCKLPMDCTAAAAKSTPRSASVSSAVKRCRWAARLGANSSASLGAEMLDGRCERGCLRKRLELIRRPRRRSGCSSCSSWPTRQAPGRGGCRKTSKWFCSTSSKCCTSGATCCSSCSLQANQHCRSAGSAIAAKVASEISRCCHSASSANRTQFQRLLTRLAEALQAGKHASGRRGSTAD